MIVYFVEIESIFEIQKTGIPNFILTFIDGLKKCDCFFYVWSKKDGRVFPFDFVELLRNNDNDYVTEYIDIKYILNYLRELNVTTVGIFTNRKKGCDFFDFSIEFVYDLTYLKFPYFHHPNTINFMSGELYEDLSSNLLNLCISKTTFNDVLYYFPTLKSKLSQVTIPINECFWNYKRNGIKRKYFCIIGTIEPRKNVRFAIKNFPFDKYPDFKIFVIGRQGWLDSGLIDFKNNTQIEFTGYLSQDSLMSLLSESEGLIYPSIYKGYGLPVMEALALHTPVVCSIGGSLSEFDYNEISFFDPFDVDSYHNALDRCIENNLKGAFDFSTVDDNKVTNKDLGEKVLSLINYSIKHEMKDD